MRMSQYVGCLLYVVAIALNGCAIKKASSTDPTIATEYELSAKAAEARPTWIDLEPEDNRDRHFLVGLSDHHASEKNARADAMRYARSEFAKYTGVKVKDVDKVLSALYGQSSAVLDATVSAISQNIQTSDASVSRIKAKQWYWEKYRVIQNEVKQGVAYKYWVLVSVPTSEYDRVQAWKQQLKSDALTQESHKKNAAQLAIKQILNHHQQQLNKIVDYQQSAKPILALTNIQGEWNDLNTQIKQFKQKNQYYQNQVIILERSQSHLVNLARDIKAAIWLDIGRWQTLYMIEDNDDAVVTAWCFMGDKPNASPLSRIPLAIYDRNNAMIANAETDHQGKVVFHLSNDQHYDDQFTIAINFNSQHNSAGYQSATTALNSIHHQLYLAPISGDVGLALKAGVQYLFNGPSFVKLPVSSIIMGIAVYEGTKRGGAFALFLSRHIAQSLLEIDGLQVIQPRKRQATLYRSIAGQRSITATTKQSPVPSMGSAAMQAAIDGADAALEISYVDLDDKVLVNLNLKQAKTDTLIAAATTLIATASIPEKYTIRPEMKQTLFSNLEDNTLGGGLTDQNSRINLEITSHFGDGQTYQAGDTISYFVSSDQAAYLLLIYEDAAGNLIQILPNFHSGNTIFTADDYVEVPDENAAFAFNITEPFGEENIWAFAASQRFPVLAGEVRQDGLRRLDHTNPASILHRLRNHGLQAGMAYGEAKTTITTVAQ